MKFEVSTEGNNDIIDITNKVSDFVIESKVRDGICLISCPGSTVGLTTIENDPNLFEDLKEFLGKIAPSNKSYHHDETWGDRNAFSHIRSALINPFLTVPIEDGKLVLGTWQQLVLIDFDNRPREREIIIKIMSSNKA